MSQFLEAQNIVKEYSGKRVLDNLNLSVDEGTIYGLLGPNGAGKSTFIRIVTQITHPDSGVLNLFGRPIKRTDVEQIGYLPEERGLYKKMRIGEQLVFLAQLKGLSKADATERIHRWLEKFEIEQWWNKKVEELSKGMQQKVQFISTVVHEPKLLIFDEPFSGFDPLNADLLKREILQLKNNGATILFSTHNMSSVEEVCDSITLINKSRNVLSGKVDEIKQQFKENIYEIQYRGADESVLNELVSVQVVDIHKGNNVIEAHVKLDNVIGVNDVIRQLIGKVELVGFKEILPSFDDIFIKVVGNE